MYQIRPILETWKKFSNHLNACPHAVQMFFPPTTPPLSLYILITSVNPFPHPTPSTSINVLSSLCLISLSVPIMGICASSHLMTAKNGRYLMSWPPTAKIIHLDGRLQEFSFPIQAGVILSQNPNCFLCSAESLFINARAPQLSHHEELQLDQIYFLIPLSKSRSPLSMQDFGGLAVKANAAIAQLKTTYLAMETGRAAVSPAAQGHCDMPSGLGVYSSHT